ncbi:histone-lysine N-methyltransferase SETMAR [Plakobranchus ocellatus]|uniref:Histone-lysine N-methyltransferase SETMAR n=1 Tax=Plakobranchus ocellatus TaxID=259542 RepID=A0AAV4DMP2_9GAST|nr:histone-lysine N-methyltransferase SETMAR [Plakobranchus ocellatus]
MSAPSVNALINSIDLKIAPPHRSVIKAGNESCCPFSVRKGTKCSVIYREIVENYGEHAMSMTQVYLWCSWFKDGRTSLQDEPRSGHPNTPNNDSITVRVDELIKIDRREKMKVISLKLDIPKTNVYEIAHDKLGYRKVPARWVPKCCQLSISARESKSLKSCCTGVNKKVMKPLMWGLAGTIVPGTSFLNTSSLEMKLGYTWDSGDKTRLNDMEAPVLSSHKKN